MKIKHILSISFCSVLFFGISEVNAQEMCIQVIQSAVNNQGECHDFATPCDVPEGWTPVSDCSLVKPKSFGSDLEETQTRRETSRWAKLREILAKKRNEKNEEKISRVPFGRAIFIKNSDEYQKRQQQVPVSQSSFKQRTYTQPAYNKKSFERFKELNPQLGGYKRELTEGERYQQNFINQGRRRPAIQSATEMKRTGYLSSFERTGVRKFKEPNWENKENVDQFWKRPQPQKRTSIRTQEEIRSRLDNRRIRLGRVERDFGIENEVIEE